MAGKRKNLLFFIIAVAFSTLLLTFYWSSKLKFAPAEQTVEEVGPVEKIRPTNNSKLDAIFYDQYKTLYNNDPPNYFDRWIAYVIEQGCYTDMKFYSSIYKDLAPFSEGITKAMLDDIRSYKKFTKVEIRNGKGLNLGDDGKKLLEGTHKLTKTVNEY
jgi:hypothetical protein